jgi:hypothetical protein
MPASAQWRRQVLTDNTRFTDFPMPHPLKYFTENPYGWSINQYGVLESDVNVVGTVAGYAAVDVLYRIAPRLDGKPTPTEVVGKSILIQSALDQYIEIWHDQQGLGPITPSTIIMVGDIPILATQHFDGGNAHFCSEAYWFIDSSGPHKIDFSDVRAAIGRVAPPNTVFLGECSDLHLEEQLIRAEVQKVDADCRACGWVGVATAHFRLDGSRAIPTDVEFVPREESH